MPRTLWFTLAIAAYALFLAVTNPAMTNEGGAYQLQGGDRVTVTVFGHPDLSGELTIEEGGNITLPIGGDVAAAGLTVAQLEAQIVRVLADGYIRRPSVTVRATGVQPVYVLGDVRTAGAVAYRPGMTALTAIALAGGLASSQQEAMALRGSLREAEERLESVQANLIITRARIARLAAQRDGAEGIDFPPDLDDGRPATARILAGELAVLTTERGAEAGQLAVWMLRLRSAEAEVAAIAEQTRLERRQLEFISGYAADLVKLQRNGLVDRRRLIEMQMEEQRARSNLARLETESGRALQMISEAPLRMAEIRSAIRQRALAALQEADARRVELHSAAAAARDQVAMLQRRVAAAGGLPSGGGGLLLTRQGAAAGPVEVAENAALRPGDVLRVNGGDLSGRRDNAEPEGN